jgi:hypothetical protein
MTVIDVLETLAADVESYDEAGRLLGAAGALREATGYRLCLSQRDADLATVPDALGDDRSDAVLAEGAALSPEQAIAYAAGGEASASARRMAGTASLQPSNRWSSLPARV